MKRKRYTICFDGRKRTDFEWVSLRRERELRLIHTIKDSAVDCVNTEIDFFLSLHGNATVYCRICRWQHLVWMSLKRFNKTERQTEWTYKYVSYLWMYEGCEEVKKTYKMYWQNECERERERDLNWKKEIWRWGKEWNKEPKLGVRERKKKVFGSKLLFHFQPTRDWEVQISPWKWGDKINSLASSPSCQENILGVHNRNKHFWNDCLVRIFQIRPFMASLFLSFQYSFLIQ